MFLHHQRVFTAKVLKPSAEVPEAQEAPHRKPVAHPQVVQSVPSPTRSTSPSWTGVRQIAFPQKLPPLPRFLAQQLLQEVTLINTEIVLIFHISSEKTQLVFGNPNERCYTGGVPQGFHLEIQASSKMQNANPHRDILFPPPLRITLHRVQWKLQVLCI